MIRIGTTTGDAGRRDGTGVRGPGAVRRVIIPLLVSTPLVLSSCATALKQPGVELTGIRLASLGISGGTVVVRLGVHNPNDFALDAGGLTYHVELSSPGADEWLELADGVFRESVRVEGRDSVVVEIPVEFSYGGLGRALRSLMDYGTVEYRIDGRIDVRRPLRHEIPYRHRGTVSIP